MSLRRRQGLALRELLVVIAIIGIPAAMLFPVSARARESARRTQCLANVKNIAIAVNMYLTDYDVLWPLEDGNGDMAAMGQVYEPNSTNSYSDAFNLSPCTGNSNPYPRPAVSLDELSST